MTKDIRSVDDPKFNPIASHDPTLCGHCIWEQVACPVCERYHDSYYDARYCRPSSGAEAQFVFDQYVYLRSQAVFKSRLPKEGV